MLDTTTTDERAKILTALEAWVRQSPGLDPRNYISHGAYNAGRAAYRSEARRITQQRHDFNALARFIAIRESITADDLKAGFRAFSGRLTWNGDKMDYCTGQYWPTEYRAAACAVMASVVWQYLRDTLPEPKTKQYGSAADHPMQTVQTYQLHGRYLSAGDHIRARARAEFGRGIQARWFR